jgi:hypothetical protein
MFDSCKLVLEANAALLQNRGGQICARRVEGVCVPGSKFVVCRMVRLALLVITGERPKGDQARFYRND